MRKKEVLAIIVRSALISLCLHEADHESYARRAGVGALAYDWISP
jgi:hypothetical protein